MLMLNWLRNRAWPVLYNTWAGFMKHDGLTFSAAMAYAAALSLFPLCLVLIAVLGFIMRFSPQVQNEQQQLLATVSRQAGPWLAEQLGGLLAGVQSRAFFGGPVGIITLILGAIGVFTQLESMFDRIWGTSTHSSRGWLSPVWTALYGRLSAFIMLLCAGGLLIVVFLADMVLTGIRYWALENRIDVVQWLAGPIAWRWEQIGFTLTCNSLLLGLIYRTLPKAHVHWREALGGGVLAAVIWAVGQRILTLFLIGKSYSAYGVVGSFVAIMLWFYYISATVFLGAEFVRAVCQRQAPEGKIER